MMSCGGLCVCMCVGGGGEWVMEVGIEVRCVRVGDGGVEVRCVRV